MSTADTKMNTYRSGVDMWTSGVEREKKILAESPLELRTLDATELLHRLDSDKVRQEILRRVNEKAAPIKSALEQKKVSVRTNKDLDGYRSYLSNINTLRRAILRVGNSQNASTADDAEEIFKIINRIDGHHERVTEDLQNKFPTLLDTTAKSTQPTREVAPPLPTDADKQELHNKRDKARQELLKTDVKSDDSSYRKETAKAPEGFNDIAARLSKLGEYNARISEAAKGNPAAIITAAGSQYTREYRPLMAEVKEEYKKLYDRAVNGADPEQDRMQLLVENIAKLDTMSTEIALYLKGITPRITTPTPVETTPAAQPAQSNELSSKTADLLAKRTAFREQWLDKKELDDTKEIGDPARLYAGEKGALRSALEKEYNGKNIFSKFGAKARAMFGMNPAAHSPELQKQMAAASEAAAVYNAGIEARYTARLDREVAAGRMTPLEKEGRQAQFRAMSANRFVYQSMDMVRTTERGALSETQESAVMSSLRWYGALPIPAKLAIGSAVTIGTGFVGGVAASAIAGRTLLKTVMISTGLGTAIGRSVNNSFVIPERENLTETVSDISRSYASKDIAAKQLEYLTAQRDLSRAKAKGVVVGALAGGVVAGVTADIGTHIFDPISNLDETVIPPHLPDNTSAPKIVHEDIAPKTVPDIAHETTTSHTTPEHQVIPPGVSHTEAPHVPTQQHELYVVKKEDTLWVHAEEKFGDRLHKNFITGHDRDHVLVNLRERLVAHPELAKELGISSGHPDMILYPSGDQVGDTLDDTLLGKLMDEEIGKLRSHTNIEAVTDDETGGDLGDLEVAQAKPAISVAPKTVPTIKPSIDGGIAAIKESTDPGAAIKNAVTSGGESFINPASVIAQSEAAVLATLGNIAENTREDLVVSEAEIKKERKAITAELDGTKGKFSSLFGLANITPSSALTGMTLEAISRSYDRLSPERQIIFAEKTQHIDEPQKIVRWIEHINLWKNLLGKGNPGRFADVRFEDFMDMVSEYRVKIGERMPEKKK